MSASSQGGISIGVVILFHIVPYPFYYKRTLIEKQKIRLCILKMPPCGKILLTDFNAAFALLCQEFSYFLFTCSPLFSAVLA